MHFQQLSDLISKLTLRGSSCAVKGSPHMLSCLWRFKNVKDLCESNFSLHASRFIRILLRTMESKCKFICKDSCNFSQLLWTSNDNIQICKLYIGDLSTQS